MLCDWSNSFVMLMQQGEDGMTIKQHNSFTKTLGRWWSLCHGWSYTSPPSWPRWLLSPLSSFSMVLLLGVSLLLSRWCGSYLTGSVSIDWWISMRDSFLLTLPYFTPSIVPWDLVSWHIHSADEESNSDSKYIRFFFLIVHIHNEKTRYYDQMD